jgi:hypothetical protein
MALNQASSAGWCTKRASSADVFFHKVVVEQPHDGQVLLQGSVRERRSRFSPTFQDFRNRKIRDGTDV